MLWVLQLRMMSRSIPDLIWLGLVFAVAFVGVGMPLWLTPYAEISLPETWFMPALLVVVPLAAGLRMTALAGAAASTTILTAAMLAANIARVAVDTGIDASSHNLWPLELIMTSFAGILASLVGYVSGMLVGAAISAIQTWRH